MPKTRMFKIGAATLAAAVGVILAITSVMAHSSPSPSTLRGGSHSVLTSEMSAMEQQEAAAKAAAKLAARQRAEAEAAQQQEEAADQDQNENQNEDQDDNDNEVDNENHDGNHDQNDD